MENIIFLIIGLIVTEIIYWKWVRDYFINEFGDNTLSTSVIAKFISIIATFIIIIVLYGIYYLIKTDTELFIYVVIVIILMLFFGANYFIGKYIDNKR